MPNRSSIAFVVFALGCSAHPVATSSAPASSVGQVSPDRLAPAEVTSASATAAPIPPPPPPPPPAPIRPPTVEWARRFGARWDDYAHALAIASDGTIVLSGTFNRQTKLDKIELAGESGLQGNPGAFVALLSADGNVRSVTNLHAHETDVIEDLAIGPDDSIAFAGSVRSMDAGCGKLRSVDGYDVLVGAFDAQGKCTFNRAYGTKHNDSGDAVAVDRAGNIILGGSAQQGAKVGGEIISTNGQSTTFAASYTKSGEHRWSLDLGQKPYAHVKAIAVDAAGNSFVGGYAPAGNFDWKANQPMPEMDPSIIAISADGKLLWSTTFVGPKRDMINDIVVDPRTGELIVVGSFWDFIDIGDVHLESAGDSDGFVARVSPKGKVLWARRFGATMHQSLTHIALDATGNLYAAGSIGNTSFVYGDTELKVLGDGDIVLISMYPDGSPRWGMVFGGPKLEFAMGLAIEASGRILLTGHFQGEADFGGIKLKSDGGTDIFVAALRP